MTTSMLLPDGTELVIQGTVHAPRLCGQGNERHTEPAEVTDITACDINGQTYELDPEQQEQAEAALVEAWSFRVMEQFINRRSE